jgi:hypothetical protein
VKAVHFGGIESESQHECSGRRAPGVDVVTKSCESLRKAGHRISGYYLTSTPGNNHINAVYCDMKINDEQLDAISSRLPKTAMVAFDAYRTTGYATVSTVIPYKAFQMETGGMDLDTGVFTAPIAGIYTFTGTWLDNSDTDYVRIYIRKNGSVIGSTFSYGTNVNSIQLTVLVSLDKGNTIDTYLYDGVIHGDSSRQIHFTGHLIYPSIDYLAESPGRPEVAEKNEDAIESKKLNVENAFIAFDVYRTSEYSTDNTIIPYEAFEMEIGGGMDLATGVFTAPTAGIYAFTGTWLDGHNTDAANVFIRKNGSVIGSTYSHTADWSSFGMTVLVSLDQGDTVDTYLRDGTVTSFSNRLYIHFIGYLIYPL